MQAYKNYGAGRRQLHFTRPESYNPYQRPLEQCRFIPIKDLHAELERKIRNHLLMQYVVVPAVGITALLAVGFGTYKNLQFYS